MISSGFRILSQSSIDYRKVYPDSGWRSDKRVPVVDLGIYIILYGFVDYGLCIFCPAQVNASLPFLEAKRVGFGAE